MSLNPSAGYWMDIFSHLFVVRIVCLFEKTKINEKEAGVGPFFSLKRPRTIKRYFSKLQTNNCCYSYSEYKTPEGWIDTLRSWLRFPKENVICILCGTFKAFFLNVNIVLLKFHLMSLYFCLFKYSLIISDNKIWTWDL